MSIHFGYIPSNKYEPEKLPYETVFNINMSNAVITPHTGKTRIKKIKDGNSYLGDGFISNRRSTTMLFNCPQMAYANISIFIVFKLAATPKTGHWGYIVGNDDGLYDKFIGYKTGSSNQLSYGGGWPVKEYNCTIPSSVKSSEKHLISCHWLMSGSCLHINGIKSTDSDFTANIKSSGAPFSSVFFNKRFSASSSGKPISDEIYGLKIVSGFLEPEDISSLNKSMMIEYSIQ